MRSIMILVAVVLVLMSAGSACAFDGHRQGFVIGGGIGFSPYLHSSPDVWSYEDHAMALHALIGYAQNEHNLLAVEGNLATQIFDGSSFLGISWYRYFGRTGRTFFSVVGLGRYDFRNTVTFSEVENHEAGFGYMVGGGFEFAEHFQFGVYLTGGKTSYNNVDYSMNHVSINFTVMAF